MRPLLALLGYARSCSVARRRDDVHRTAACRSGSLCVADDSVFDLLVAGAAGRHDVLEDRAGLIESNETERAVEVDHRARCTADDGTVGVRATLGLEAVLLALACGVRVSTQWL